jgi:hypothetical protein
MKGKPDVSTGVEIEKTVMVKPKMESVKPDKVGLLSALFGRKRSSAQKTSVVVENSAGDNSEQNAAAVEVADQTSRDTRDTPTEKKVEEGGGGLVRQDSIQRDVAELRCGHAFHVDCIINWSKSNSTCPGCRVSFEANEIDVADDADEEAPEAQQVNSDWNGRGGQGPDPAAHEMGQTIEFASNTYASLPSGASGTPGAGNGNTIPDV